MFWKVAIWMVDCWKCNIRVVKKRAWVSTQLGWHGVKIMLVHGRQFVAWLKRSSIELSLLISIRNWIQMIIS